MKNPFRSYLFIILLLIAFTVGIFVGRSASYGNVSISVERESFGNVNDSTSAGIRLNINTASVDELQQIPGLGPALAQRIVDYRNEHGQFVTTDDLLNVSGIGDAKLSAIIPYITVGG